MKRWEKADNSAWAALQEDAEGRLQARTAQQETKKRKRQQALKAARSSASPAPAPRASTRERYEPVLTARHAPSGPLGESVADRVGEKIAEPASLGRSVATTKMA